MAASRIVVVTGPRPSLPWESLFGEELEIVRWDPRDSKRSLRNWLAESATVVLDLTGADLDVVLSLDREVALDPDLRGSIRSDVAAGVTNLAVACTLDEYSSLYTLSGALRLYIYEPWLYTPVVLELRRLLEAQVVGAWSRLEIDLPSALAELRDFRVRICAGFFGMPVSDVRFEGDESSVLAHATVRSVEKTIILTCAFDLDWHRYEAIGFRGTIAGVTGDRTLRLVRFDDDGELVPLPEGDGSYYFMRDAIHGGSTGAGPAVLPAGLVEWAFCSAGPTRT